MKQKRYAILIGANGPASMRLDYAERDADLLTKALQNHQCSFDMAELVIADHERKVLDKLSSIIKQCHSSDLLVVHFSGHGFFEDQLYLVCNDTEPDNIISTGLGITRLKALLRKCPAKNKLLILDCCRAGEATAILKGKQDLKTFLQDTMMGSATVVLAACPRKENARELKDLDGGSGFLSWAIRAACTTNFPEAYKPDHSIYSLNDIWNQWIPKALNYVNTTLCINDPLPPPVLVSELESGYGNDIWFLKRPQDQTKVKLDPDNNQITQSDYFEKALPHSKNLFQPFDHHPSQYNLADLKIDKLHDFFNKDLVRRQDDFSLESSFQEKLIKFGLLRESHVTYGALLCFGNDVQSLLPGAITRCILWKGNSRDNGYEDDRECRGDLLQQLEASLNFLRKCLRRNRDIDENGRTEKYEIPFIALQEAITNALIHREYARISDRGDYIGRTEYVQIEIFDNRVEIKSPGIPPIPLNSISTDDASHPVNPVIARIFYLFGHIERVGSGIQRMQNAMQEAQLPLVKFELNETKTFKVILERPVRLELTPNASILSVLGEIAFQPWQCITELMDSSINSFLMKHGKKPISQPIIHIAFGRDSVIIKDNSPGWALDELSKMVRTGWSSSDPFGNQIYGIGFNIATARLGAVTVIWTTQEGEDRWHGLEIDLRSLGMGNHYKAIVKERPKSDVNISGTEIEVTNIKSVWKDSFTNSPWIRSHIADRLARIYGAMLRDTNPQPIKFSLYVNNKKVLAWEHCTWPEDLTVYRKDEGLVHPIQEIDENFPPKFVSRSTGEIYDTIEGLDPDDIMEIPGKVYGWIGIQRYADEKDFGIDILRNGRKIEVGCKDLFMWEKADGETQLEYPIDDPRHRGRIVGEIHLDHGYVHYTKDRFDREHYSWNQLKQAIRYNEPLTHRYELGYTGLNTSPLGILFRAFRRNSPSMGGKMTYEDLLFIKDNEIAKAWAQEYRKGNSDYRDNNKWLEELQKSDENRSRTFPLPQDIPSRSSDKNFLFDSDNQEISPYE